MNKINKKLIVFGFKVLSIGMFGLLVIPTNASAVVIIQTGNPTPYISSISPNSSNNNAGAVVIAITGRKFIPSSIARVNGSERITVFIDSSHLLVKLYPSDTYNTDGFYINVFNGLPDGGYSNAEFFTVNIPAPVTNINNNPSYTITKNTTTARNNNTNSDTFNTYSNINTTQTRNTTNADNNINVDNTDKNYSALASNAIFGSNGFLPSGLTQWVILGIIILLIVILVRKIFSARKNYDETPMKHA